jgi:hypothetical protein
MFLCFDSLSFFSFLSVHSHRVCLCTLLIWDVYAEQSQCRISCEHILIRSCPMPIKETIQVAETHVS